MLPLLALVTILGEASDPVPAPEDVKAGWGAFGLFLLLGVAVVVLAFSFRKQLRKAQAARDAGVYGDAPAPPEDTVEDSAGDQAATPRRPGAAPR